MLSAELPCSCTLPAWGWAGSAPAGSTDGCGPSRARGCPEPAAPHQFLAPGITVFFSNHVPLQAGGESHEHPPSWALGMGHCHRAQLTHGQHWIPDPGQGCSELSWLPWQTWHSPLEGFGWLPGDQARHRAVFADCDVLKPQAVYAPVLSSPMCCPSWLSLLIVMSSSPKLCVLLSPPAPRAVPLGSAAGAKRSTGSR